MASSSPMSKVLGLVDTYQDCFDNPSKLRRSLKTWYDEHKRLIRKQEIADQISLVLSNKTSIRLTDDVLYIDGGSLAFEVSERNKMSVKVITPKGRLLVIPWHVLERAMSRHDDYDCPSYRYIHRQLWLSHKRLQDLLLYIGWLSRGKMLRVSIVSSY